MTNETRSPVLFVKNDTVVANSRDVAAYFGKRHADVLRAVDGLECSIEFTERNFAFSAYTDRTGRELRSVDMIPHISAVPTM